MAKTIYLNDGSTEVVLEDEQTFFKRLIYEKIGRDAEEMFNAIIEDLTEEPDGEDWEKIADGYHIMLLDTLEKVNWILNYAKGSYMTKKTLIAKLQNCKDELYHNL